MEVVAIIEDREVLAVWLDGKEAERIAQDECCRQVFAIGQEYVVKFDSSPYEIGDEDEEELYYRQTTLELEFLHEIEEEHRKYFVLPETFGEIDGMNYTVQKFVHHTKTPTDEQIEELFDVVNHYNLEDVYCSKWLGNPMLKNCVFNEDGWQIYDYAPI